jgi:uncharacterized membrane protein YeaQ/YmgE (transglycosylase-associated protein family)
MIDIHLTVDEVIVWILVGLVAGSLAGRVALGRDLGLLGDVVAGIIGAFLGGVLAQIFKVHISIAGSSILSEIVVAFAGAVLLLLVLRVFGFGRGGK